MNYALGVTSIVVSHDVKNCRFSQTAATVVAGGKVATSGSFVELKVRDSEIVNQFRERSRGRSSASGTQAPNYYKQLLSGA